MDIIPAMDLLDEELATNAANTTLDPAIHIAVGATKQTINHYYDKTDVLVLDPHHKLQYFKDNGWLESWISDTQFAT